MFIREKFAKADKTPSTIAASEIPAPSALPDTGARSIDDAITRQRAKVPEHRARSRETAITSNSNYLNESYMSQQPLV